MSIAYNRSFTRSNGRSYSLPMRPDVTVTVGSSLHLLDAKFKVAWIETGAGEDSDVGAFKRDDIAKMHAYRDAIRGARSAWVLYPGTQYEFFPIERDGAEGVGVIPLRPGNAAVDELRCVLRRVLVNGP